MITATRIQTAAQTRWANYGGCTCGAPAGDPCLIGYKIRLLPHYGRPTL